MITMELTQDEVENVERYMISLLWSVAGYIIAQLPNFI